MLALCLALLTGAGCTPTATLMSARQLEAGEVALGGGGDWPGQEYWPRMAAYGVVGVAEKGDLGVVAGYDFVSANLGLSARAYPGEGWMLGVQAEARRDVWRSRDPGDRPVDQFVVTSRISSAVQERGGMYVGVEGTLLSRWFYNSETEVSTLRLWGLGFGGFVGAERRLSEGWSLQAEMMLRPLFIDMYYGYVDIFEAVDSGIGFQGSVGVNYRFGGGEERARPTASEEVPGEEVEREEEVPGYDGEGVPLY